MDWNRRDVLGLAAAATLSWATPRRLLADDGEKRTPAHPSITPETGRGPSRGPRQDLLTVFAFVQAAHDELPKVKQMVNDDPRLVYASWDWGDGDWESALEGAAHMGKTEIVTFLLSKGARVDSFSLAMLGQTDAIRTLVSFDAQIANARGPHGLPLMFYVGLAGQVAMAEAVAPLLSERGRDCNVALNTATLSGHTEMVAWLIDHGVTDLNRPNVFDKTPLDVAIENDFHELAALLEGRGARRASDLGTP